MPDYEGTKVWKVTIRAYDGSLEYKDEDSTMVGNLNVYWGWDSKDQVWVYSGDDGRVHKWRKNSTWKKTLVKDEGIEKIPEWILPDYARKKLSRA